MKIPNMKIPKIKLNKNSNPEMRGITRYMSWEEFIGVLNMGNYIFDIEVVKDIINRGIICVRTVTSVPHE